MTRAFASHALHRPRCQVREVDPTKNPGDAKHIEERIDPETASSA